MKRKSSEVSLEEIERTFREISEEEQMETLETGGGNTISPPVRIVPSKRWCFTYNNPPEGTLETMETLFNKFECKYIMGREVGESGTPHIQGYIESAKKIRPIERFGIKEIHWEKCKGNREANLKYCAKDGDYVHSPEFKVIRPLAKMKREYLRDDQKLIVDHFKEFEDPLWGRKIYWFWEPTGNWGKSVVAEHMIDYEGAIEVSGAGKDVFFGIASALETMDIKTVILDIPRQSMAYVQYQAIEKIKDGKFFSGKYEGKMIRYNRPHIVVFANEEPEYTNVKTGLPNLSMDRWEVIRLDVPGELAMRLAGETPDPRNI